jgi:sorting nexin-29
VRQGDALSAILFDLVLEAIFQKMNITGYIGIKSTQILAYADDVAMVSRNKNALKDTLDTTESEARKRDLLINENKNKYMEVTRTVVNGEHFQRGKYKFEHVKDLPYLGTQLYQTNSTNSEIHAKIIGGNKCYYSFGKLIKSSALKRNLNLKICKSLISPVVTY